MKLHYREIGEGEPLLILHGLYACSDNWLSIAKMLKDKYHIIIPDSRNHGHSPKSPTHSYDDMCYDTLELINNLNINKINIIGHSMGGKTAMQFACAHPERINKLIIVDIAPIDYNIPKYKEHIKRHEDRIQLLESIKLTGLFSISALLTHLKKLKLDIDDQNLIAKNIFKNTNGQLDWRLNIPAIKKEIKNILCNNLEKSDCYTSLCHFIKGEHSDYLTEMNFSATKRYFTDAKLHIIRKCGHSIHIEQPKLLSKTIENILRNN